MELLEIANTAGRRLSPACQDSPSACPSRTARAFQRCASQSLRRGVRVWLTALVLTCWVVRDDETGTIASPAWRLWPRTAAGWQRPDTPLGRAVRQPVWRWFEAFPLKASLLCVLDRIVTAKETSSGTERHPHSKRRVYLVQNTRSNTVLDSSGSSWLECYSIAS